MNRLTTGLQSPMPDRSHFKPCKCGELPRWGMNAKGKYRIFCMKLKRSGCSRTTDYYKTKELAKEDWVTVASK